MDGFDEAAVLDYARSRGIASNHQQLDPMNLLAQIRDSEHAQILSPSEPLSQLIDFGALDLPNHTSPFASQSGKLVLDKDGVRFLTSVLQDVTSIQANPDHRAEDTIALELKYKPTDHLKLEVPLLSTEKQGSMKILNKRADPVELLNEVVPDLAVRERTSIDEGLEFPDYFWELPAMLDRDPEMEKLEAPVDTRRFLLDALTYLDESKHRQGVEELVANSMLDMAISSQLSTPPLYIDSKDQHEQCDTPESCLGNDTDSGHDIEAVTKNLVTTGLCKEVHSNLGDAYISVECDDRLRHNTQSECRGDTQMGLINDAVVEGVFTPKLLTKDRQLAEYASPLAGIMEVHECSVVTESHNSSDADADPKLPIFEDSATPERVEEQDPYVEGTVNNKRAASPFSDEIPEENTLGSSKSRNSLLPVTNPPAAFGGSLGTLSAFMQTRRLKNKRPKVDHESRYFSSLPNTSTKNLPIKFDTPAKPKELTKLPSSPVVTQKIQSLNLYPRNDLKESDVTLTLILSTQLLRSDSALVRSLEDVSSHRSLRLIFRDYQVATPSQLHVVDEADMIVSPTTGIILSSSHETTQKYLPGQGSPGIESPLQARIVRSAPRYEMLYVLIRSPIEMTKNFLSSIRCLTTYCITLNRVCNIKVLLVTTDCVLEWILSIAAKHSASSPNTEEDKTLGPEFHDEQTRWELFLRGAGLNPFAAQSILAMLKTSSTQSDRPQDINQPSALSRFVEMPCHIRRDMFHTVLGQGVLSRVNRALEMDWQVDWAVDLM